MVDVIEIFLQKLADDGFSIEIRKVKSGYMITSRFYDHEETICFSAKGETIQDAIANYAEKHGRSIA